jgi:signal transduction histidine kinase/DNA-binding NarL/FixJ family response regulator
MTVSVEPIQVRERVVPALNKLLRPGVMMAALGAVLGMTVLAAVGLSLWSARKQEIASWEHQLGNLSLILAEQTSQELNAAQLVMDSVAEQVHAAGIDSDAALRATMGGAGVQRSMRDKIEGLPHIDVVSVVAANGDLVNFTRSFPTPPINLAERDYFQERRRDPSLALFISAPVRNKGNGGWTFYLNRRLNGPDGQFLGVVLVGLSSSYLSSFYQKISLGEGASITLYRRDFTMLARWPHVDAMMGQVNRSGISYQLIEVQGRSSGVTRSDLPRVSAGGASVYRMGAPRMLEKYPLIVNISVTDRLFLARWREFAVLLAIVAGCSLLAIGLALRLLYKALRQRDADLQLTESLRADAEAASHAKSEFLAMMSHEIRTPLTAIIGFAETLDDATDRARRHEAAEVITRNGQHLLAIINDILDISKIEAGRLHLEHVAFSPIDTAWALDPAMSAQAGAKGVQYRTCIEYPFPASVMGDPTRWRQVLFNLCSNAVKFTERGSVTLTVWYDSASARLMCSVVDTGIGISEAQHALLFAPFAQADSAVARKYGGTGLGLHLVRRLAHKMGGSVQVASELGRGAVFEVAVAARPADGAAWLAQAPPAPLVVAPAPPPLLRGAVLLAEDGPDNRRLLSLMLGALGLDVQVAEDGARAVDMALARRFDVILMDIQMPVMDGIAATALIRATGYRGPVVALTANVMAEDVQRYLANGFSHCVAKPVVRAELSALLASLLAQAAPQQPDDDLDELPGMAALRAAFAARLPQQLQQMAEWAGQDAWQQVAASAHQLKGSAGSFGQAGLGERAGLLEAAVRSADIDAARACLAQLLAHAGDNARPPHGT